MRKLSIILQAVFLALCGVTAAFYLKIGWEQIRYGNFVLIGLLVVLFGFVALLIILFGLSARALPKVRRLGTAGDMLALCYKLLCAMQVFPIVGGYLLSGVTSGGINFTVLHIIILAWGTTVLLFSVPRIIAEEYNKPNLQE